MKVSSKYMSWKIKLRSFPRRQKSVRIKNAKWREKKHRESGKC